MIEKMESYKPSCLGEFLSSADCVVCDWASDCKKETPKEKQVKVTYI